MGPLSLSLLCPVVLVYELTTLWPEIRKGPRRRLDHAPSHVPSALWSVKAHVTHLQSGNTDKPISHFDV